MFIQSASVSIIATLTTPPQSLPLPLPAALLVCAVLLQLNAGSGVGVAAAFDWQQVKPMYLVSMYPAQTTSLSASLDQDAEMSASTYDAADAATATADDEEEREPLVLNLETTPLKENMLPEGAMAMDRIFGGNVGNPNCFPYQVGMLLQRPKGLYWCGGSLISEQYVLTAAHCVDMAKRALVFLGANEIKNAKEKGQVRLMVPSSNFQIYPTWNPRRLKDDIALIRLPHAISFNERIHPIQLPKRHYEYRSFKNKLAIASGWGRYATGVHAISNVLRYVQLQIVDGRTCKRNFPLSYRGTNICTSGRNSRSTCNGDSGGPLVLQRRQSKKRVLVGVTSFGSIYGCDRGYPAAFTKVASYLDWISDETGVHSHQDTTEAIFFDQYIKSYGKQHNRHNRSGKQGKRQPEDDLPDELDVRTDSGSEEERHESSQEERPPPRYRSSSGSSSRSKSEHDFFFL